MYVYPYAYAVIQFICILSSQYAEYVLTIKVYFQFGCWIVLMYCAGERWHVLPCGTKKLCCGINMNCGLIPAGMSIDLQFLEAILSTRACK
jgi:hypothetical protein